MSLENIDENLKVISVEAKDLRWPTSLGGHGSDAMVCKLMLAFFSISISHFWLRLRYHEQIVVHHRAHDIEFFKQNN